MIVPIMGNEEDVHFVNCIGARACGLRSTSNHTDNRVSSRDGDVDNGGSDKYGSSDDNEGSGHDHNQGSGHDDNQGSGYDLDEGSGHDDNRGSDHDRHDTA